MSFGFSVPIGPSRIEGLVLAGGLMGGLACLAQVASPLGWAAGAAAAGGWAAWSFRRRERVARMAADAGGLRVADASGVEERFEADDVFASGLLIVFAGRVQAGGQARRRLIALWRDAVPADAFRRAAVYARWRAAGVRRRHGDGP